MHTTARITIIALLLGWAFGAAGAPKSELDPDTPGYVLVVGNGVGPLDAEAGVPLNLFRGDAPGPGAAAITCLLSYNPSALEFVRLDTSNELDRWYGKELYFERLTPGLVRLFVAGVNFREITTFDDQRFGGDDSDQINPFPLGKVVFRVIEDSPARTPLTLSDAVMLSGALAAAEIELVTSYTRDGSFSVGTDTDGDGMSDEFEARYQLNPANASDADDDPDADGLNNLRESIVGSNPRSADARSRFYVSPTGSDTGGDGTALMPWQTIVHAISEATKWAFPFNPVTVSLAPGAYAEQVGLAPYVTVAGAGRGNTVISWDPSFMEEVISGASNSGLRDCRVTVPETTTDPFVLLQIDRVSMRVENVDLDGRGLTGSVGVQVLGLSSSGTRVSDSVIHRLDIGVQAFNSAAMFARNLFEDIRVAAVSVELPLLKEDSVLVAPVLGDSTRPDDTGLNQFRDIEGVFIQNETEAQVLSEINDWGVYTEPEIAAQMSGPVNFDSFFQKSIGPGTVAVTVWNGATGTILPATTVASVSITSLSLSAEHDGGANLYVFDAVPSGHHLIRGTATGIGTGETFVDVDGLGVKAAEVTLAAGNNGGGCGKSAARSAEQRRSAAFGSLWVNAGVVLVLSTMALARRHR